MGRTSSAVKDRYNKKAYDTIVFRVYKGSKDIIKEAADAAGLSLNAYIVDAINEKMDREGTPAEEREPDAII